MRNSLAGLLITLAFSVASFAQQPSRAATLPTATTGTSPAASQAKPLAALDFLVGAWEAEPGAEKGSAHFTFAYDADGAVLVRRNHAEYPAIANRPATKHDDLLVIYRDPDFREAEHILRADYWDNEGHVIHYSVAATAEGVDFVSNIQQGAPTFRLRYKKLGADRVAIDFEIAPPGNPSTFSPYLSGTARRLGSAN